MKIKTFVVLCQAAEFCVYKNQQNCDVLDDRIQETIDNYCSKNNVVETDRKIVTTVCEGNGYFVCTITSKFENKD